MYVTDAKCYSWSRTTAGRGKRTVSVTTGCYLVEHISTGKYLSGVSNNVSADVDRLITSIDSKKSPSKAMHGLCNLDSDIRLIEFPTKSLKIAKQVLEGIRNTTEPQYLILK